MSKELETKVECFTIKKPKYQKLYIQGEDCVDTIVINEKEYKCSDIVKNEKALEIIKEKGISMWALEISNNVEQYNSIRNGYCYDVCVFVKELIKQEYDLLKEVLL